eukprot:5519134-Pyramimonas_sp.AAC.1
MASEKAFQATSSAAQAAPTAWSLATRLACSACPRASDQSALRLLGPNGSSVGGPRWLAHTNWCNLTAPGLRCS